MFFNTSKMIESFGINQNVYQAIAEWAIEHYLTSVPIMNGNSLELDNLASLVTKEQVDSFMEKVKENVKDMFENTVDHTAIQTMRYDIKNDIFINAAKHANFPSVFLPPNDVVWPAINFCRINGVKMVTWEQKGEAGTVFKLADQLDSENSYTSKILELLRAHFESNSAGTMPT